MVKKLDTKINGRDIYQMSEEVYTCKSTRKGDSYYSFYLTDCLEKVFPNVKPRSLTSHTLFVVPGEIPAIQLVYHYHPGSEYKSVMPYFNVSVDGSPVQARIRSVECVASDYPANELADDNYITKEAGTFPDLLLPMDSHKIRPVHSQYRALWIDFPKINPEHAGQYAVSVHVRAEETMESMGLLVDVPGKEELGAHLSFEMCVLPVALKPQTTIHTEWFHSDSLCDYYQVSAFSEAHWQQIDNFIKMAAEEHAVNMMLTPVFTPALNTGVGLERTTTQLVDIELRDGEYSFGFEKLDRWCAICRKHGIEYLEISHFFTQWGAQFTPKIVAKTPDGEKRIFGWDVAATDPEYRRFLASLLPKLCDKLQKNGFDATHVRFHISDEPFAALHHTESYLAAKQVLDGLLDDYIIMDALSDYALYEQNISKHPIPANDHFHEFYEKGFDDPWVYYCTMQGNRVPNRFMSMPSARSRIMGVLMYVYDIKGFLHWGYNYYSDMYSTQKLNPFWQTSSGRCFPSGDAYLVYPGEDYQPLSSIRAEVVRSSFDDVRLLQLLEGYIGREATLAIIHEMMGDLSFFQYPRDPDSLLKLHDRVWHELEHLCK